jgi:hypothetical protein
MSSLLPGRNTAPLNDNDIKRISNNLLGLDSSVAFRYVEGATTRFQVSQTEDGEEFGEIIFSKDVYPGNNIANPNSALSLKSAIAHELGHFHRWENRTELAHGFKTHIDEAMTSLEAALRYGHKLDKTDIDGLISDALHRLQLYIAEEG